MIISIIMVLITSFCIYGYIQRANLDYNTEGRYFSIEEGVVYKEQTKEWYGGIAVLGLIATGILTYKIMKK